jgi:hypothetical protein
MRKEKKRKRKEREEEKKESGWERRTDLLLVGVLSSPVRRDIKLRSCSLLSTLQI